MNTLSAYMLYSHMSLSPLPHCRRGSGAKPDQAPPSALHILCDIEARIVVIVAPVAEEQDGRAAVNQVHVIVAEAV